MGQKVYLSSPEEPRRHWDGPLRGPGRGKHSLDYVLYTHKCDLYGPAEGSRALGSIYL